MANLTPEPDTQDLLKRNVLGPAIFVLGAFVAVMMALDWQMTAGNGLVGDLARSIKNSIGALPAFLAGAGTAWAGARLFLQNEPDDTLHHLAGWILVSLALALVLAPIRANAGGELGNWITGRWKVLGFFIGLAALFAPVWFFWLRDRFVLPDESEMPESLSQTLLDEGGSGISAEEADALLPMDDDSYQPARQNPKLAALLAESLANKESTQTLETKAPSPYPDDVRKSGGIPAGTVPIAAPARDKDGNVAFAAGVGVDGAVEDDLAAVESDAANVSKGSESVHRWAPKERRLAGQTLGEDLPEDEQVEAAKAPRKLQVKNSGATALPLDVRPIEDMVDIPPRPIWEAEEAGDDTAGAIADALFGDGPIGPVRTLPHDAPGAAKTIAADAERTPGFSIEAPELEEIDDPELEEDREVAEWEDEEESEDDDEEALEDDEVNELDDDEEYEDEEEYEDDEAAELEEEDEDEEEYEDEDDEEAAELEDDEEYEEEDEDEEDDAEAAELEDDEEEEYEDEEEAAELEEDDPEEDEDYEDEEDEAAELEEDEPEEYEEAAELEDDESLEEDEDEAAELEEVPDAEPSRAESEVVLTPKAPPAPQPAATTKAVDAGGRVSPEIVYDAGVLFLERGRVAVSLLQREFSLDFDESCEVMDRLQKLGLIGPYVGGHRRDILLSREEWLEKATVG